MTINLNKVIISLASIALLAVGSSCIKSKTTVSRTGTHQEQMDPAMRRKFDPHILINIEQPPGNKQFNVIVRTTTPIDASQKALLEQKGIDIGSIHGDIFTAIVSAKSLIEISKLDFVVYIEMAKEMRPK